MAVVLRGGKWGAVASSSPADREDVSHHSDRQNDSESEHEAEESVLALFEDRNQLAVACLNISSNQINISKFPSEQRYESLSRLLDSLEKYCCIVPASYKENKNLISLFIVSEHTNGVDQNSNENTSVDGDADDGDDNNDKDNGDQNESSPTDENENGYHEINPEVINLRYLPNKDFSLSKALQQCALLSVAGMPSHLGGEARIDYLSHTLGQDESITRVLGGLLTFAIDNNIFGPMESGDDVIHVDTLSYRNFCNTMRCSLSTMRALSVFSNDVHPIGRGSLRGKEGLSLFGILKSHTRTSTSRHLLRSWLLYPSTSVELLHERQCIVISFRHKSSRPHLGSLRSALRGVRNVPVLFRHVRKSASRINDFSGLRSSALSFGLILETMKNVIQIDEASLETKLVKTMLEVDEAVFRQVLELIDSVVNFKDSKLSGRLVVVHGYSEELDEMRRLYAGLDDFLTRVGTEEMQIFQERHPDVPLESLKFTYEPQIGFLLAISSKNCEEIGIGSMEALGLSFLSSDERTHFFKNERCRELDEEIGDIHGAIRDLEDRAFLDLERKLLENATPLILMYEYCQELDCLQAFASAADEYSWIMPKIQDSCEGLTIVDGRHALLDLTVPCFVPNSTRMKTGDINIITGPNYSGKSVYLSQVALIIILAQIGSCVPAKKAELHVIDGIFTRMTNFESVSQRQSSFFSDASQVSSMLAEPSTRSLNLVDEFGKGTSEADGVALFLSILRALAERPFPNAPITLCATHFTDVLKEPFLPLSNQRLAVFSMEVLTKSVTDRTSNSDSQLVNNREKRPKLQLIPGMPLSTYASEGSQRPTTMHDDAKHIVRTFRLRSGSICQESHALQCALEAGVSKALLRRIAHFRAATSGGGNIEKACASPADNERIRLQIAEVRNFLNEDYS